PPLLSPVALLSFLAVLSGTGYILMRATSLSPAAVLVLSALAALLLVTAMVFLVLVPLSKAEQSNSIRMQDFIGTFGEVTITVPENGCG
ncbi:hypothetical protein, partial [Methylobacterium nigriterrae]|uniref:hypothetical protein n=1 Tax=Methylobacterium nigriterrae TaxID=3127512 RepID=UPI0030134FD7